MTLALLLTAATGAWAGVTPVSVAGNWLNPQWDPTTNQMAYKDGVYSITFSNMPAGQNYEFKFALNNSWAESYGYSSTTAVELNKTLEIATQSGVDTNIKFDLAEACDVTISFNLTEPRTFMISTSGLVIGEDDKAPIKVAYNTAKTTASFTMPASDVTVNYELVRDMTVDVDATIADRIRIQKENNAYVAVTATELIPAVSDKISGTAVAMTATTDYTAQLQKKTEGDTPTWADATTLSVGTFRYVITGTGLYDGEITTNEFQLFEGYEVTIPAGEYATYFKDEALYVENENAQLYTISSVTESEAVLSDAITVAPANTPLLVYNKSQTETLTFLLIPTTDKTPDNVTAATQFVGTLEATTIPASATGADNYALNGYAFVWVKNAIEVGANKCWLHIVSQLAGARANTRSITGGNGTTGIDAIENVTIDNEGWYDLQGRKLQAKPNRGGIYIHNGKKVVVRK